jgi:hypothetical protein
MNLQFGRKRYFSFLFATITLGLTAANPGAQTATLLPSVDLRRHITLDSDIWPADFNGDGITDLIASRHPTAPGGTAAMQVVIGRGDGTFGTPIAAAFAGRVLGVDDFNGDRRVDVVAAANPPAEGVFVLAGNGNGTFAAPRQIDSAFGAVAITGDFNGDARRDLILAGGPEVRVFPGNGNLTFGTPSRIPLGEDGTSAECLESIQGAPPCGGGIAGDFDNDGDRDFALTSIGNTLYVFLNSGGLLFSSNPITVAFMTTDVTARDLNGDGALDLVVTSTFDENGTYFDGSVHVLNGVGNGTFRPAVRYETGPGPFQVVVGDFTHDGQIDIATANRSFIRWPNCGPFLQSSDSVSILPGNRGVFGAATTFAFGDQSQPVSDDDTRYRNTVFSLNTSDLDRDRFPDLIASNGAILLTRPPAANRPPVANAGPDVNQSTGTLVRLVGTATDPDNHLLDFVWRGPEGTDGSILHPSSFCFEGGLGPGEYTFRLSVDDGQGGRDDDSAVYTLRDTSIPPEVQIVRPAAGEVVPAGTPYTIRWTASDDVGITKIDVSVFPEGRPAFQLPECTALPGDATECRWLSPRPSENVTIFVDALDTDGNSGGAMSAPFFIRGAVPPDALPEGWTNRDIGAVGAAGGASFSGGRFTVRGSGADIWGSADEFHYVYRAQYSNSEITARVDNVQNVNRWVKAGLMIRESASPGARHVSLFATPTTERGVAFQRRTSTGGTSVHTAGPAIIAPLWLKLTRVGDVFRAFYRKSIVDPWTFIGEETLPDFPLTAFIGLAVSSHVDGRLAQATFSEVSIVEIPSWTETSIGTSTGDARFDYTRFSLDGSGADIWGTADAFTFLHSSFVAPDQTLTARVLSIENTNVWAKAGVMVRETLAPDSAHVMVIVSPGRGVAMQWRPGTGAPSMSTTPRPGAAPAWVRLVRRVNTYTGYTSTDGVTWVALGTVEIPMSPSVYGLAVTSHNAAAVATAVFDDVRREIQ